jgi:predicted Zn-dependent protease with MMP-like domain
MSRFAWDWSDARAPSLDDFAKLAEQALAALPTRFRELVGEVEMRISDFAEDEVLDDLGIESAFELTGLYHGVDLSRRSIFELQPSASRVFLYRRPILDEWCERGDVGLGELVRHVLIHEIGHHFGLSDHDIDSIERED